MADEPRIDIDIVLDDATLNSGLQRTAHGIREAVQAARGLQEQFAATLATATKLRAEMAANPIQAGLRDQLRQADADLPTATAAFTAARQAATAPIAGAGAGSAGGTGGGQGGGGGGGQGTPPGVGGAGGAGAGGPGGLFNLQAQIAANYVAIGAGITTLRVGLQQLAEFDDRLRQFQAITETTNTEMVGFRDRLLEVDAGQRHRL